MFWPFLCSSEHKMRSLGDNQPADRPSKTNNPLERNLDLPILPDKASSNLDPPDPVDPLDLPDLLVSLDIKVVVESLESPALWETWEAVDTLEPPDPLDLREKKVCLEIWDKLELQDHPGRTETLECLVCLDPRDTEDSLAEMAKREIVALKVQREAWV